MVGVLIFKECLYSFATLISAFWSTTPRLANLRRLARVTFCLTSWIKIRPLRLRSSDT
jgi:hypothetical protein